MSKESQKLAKRRKYDTQRMLLILMMGSKCAYCQERRPWELEFHHTVQTSRQPNDRQGMHTSRHQRIRWYMRDWLDGRCVLACSKCNKKKGQPPLAEGEVDEPVPF